jgi:hypothetical protein
MPLGQLSSYVERRLAASTELTEAFRRLSLGAEDVQGEPMDTAITEDPGQLVREHERVSGLPMNAQVTLAVNVRP